MLMVKICLSFGKKFKIWNRQRCSLCFENLNDPSPSSDLTYPNMHPAAARLTQGITNHEVVQLGLADVIIENHPTGGHVFHLQQKVMLKIQKHKDLPTTNLWIQSHAQSHAQPSIIWEIIIIHLTNHDSNWVAVRS